MDHISVRRRGRHRRPDPTPRRLATIAAVTACALLAPVAASGPSASQAGGVGLPSVPPVDVQIDNPEDTMNRVYGLVGNFQDFIDQSADPDAAQQLLAEQSPTIHGEDPVNVVYGTVANAQGIAMAGVTVVLELVPSEGYDPTGDGSLVWELTRTVTDAVGHYIAVVPTTDEVLAEAEYLNGTVNMMVTAIKYQATGRADGAYVGAGAIYTSMVEYGPGVGGVALSPVNVGVMVVEDVKAMAGASGLVEVTPGNDPEDPSTVAVDRPNVLVGPAGDAVASVPAVSEPYVETPPVYTDSYVALPPDFPDMPADFAKDDDGTATGDARCKSLENQGRWFVDAQDVEYRWQPVGEVHSVPGTKVKYDYSERANTQLGAGVKVNSAPWKISGATSVTNDSGASVTLPYQPDSFARRIEGEFVYHYSRRTWCPEGYDEEDGPRALHMEEVVGKQWAGGLKYGSRDISGRDNGNEAQNAREEGRVGSLYKEAVFTKPKGKTFKYTADVSAFGVGLNAESVNDAKHTLVLAAGTSRERWTIFGDVGVPTDAANHAINIYY